MNYYHWVLFMHLLFVEPLPHIPPLCASFPVFPLSPLYIPPPPHSYSLCVSYIYSRSPPYLIPPPLIFHFFLIFNFTLDQVKFFKIFIIIIFSFFFYSSNDT